MGWKTIRIIFLFVILVSCKPYPNFKYENKNIYVFIKDNKYILSTNPTLESSKNYLIIQDYGDTFDRLLFYVNLCDTSYHVIVRGSVEVIGNPEFTYEEIGWYFDERQKRLEREYSLKSDCKFRYYE